MIIGDQPAHYRYAWDQTQYRTVGDSGYLSKALTNRGATNLLAPSDPALGAIEPDSFHHFQLTVVAGPYLPCGFYRASVSETPSQLCARLGLTQLAQPRLATFNYNPSTGAERSASFTGLRLYADPETSNAEASFTVVTDTAYTAQGDDELYALCMVLGAEELQLERPVLLLPLARGETLPAGTYVRVNEAGLFTRMIDTSWTGISTEPYRGRN